MRINAIGTPPLTVPEVRSELGAAPRVNPVDPRPQTPPGAQPLLPLPEISEPVLQPVQAERRGVERRATDRRQRQVPVLIDTRVSQRRVQRRRAEDEPPASIDVEA
jgi:hypothetical protein